MAEGVRFACATCGEAVVAWSDDVEGTVDSHAPRDVCEACGKEELVATFELGGRRCPSCPSGRFARDPDFLAIS